MPVSAQVDLFCRVIDNYGDLGVCWRLARRLAQGHGAAVRLWVDDLQALQRLAPGVTVDADTQPFGTGIALHHWHDDVAWPAPAPCVIEAFGCDLPERFVAQMPPDQRWYNLEYLSAEDWVAGCHGLESPQPGGQRKTFWFPGFTGRTGGLLREPGLIEARVCWQADAESRGRWLRQLGVPLDTVTEVVSGYRRLITVFAYPDAPGAAWLAPWAREGPPALVLLAGGTGQSWALPLANPRLIIQRVPFLKQPDYDRLLWSADLNFVRGEDSFVRAQWAARPFIWQTYPQADAAHTVKLDAWLACSGAPPSLAAAMHQWNGSSHAAQASLPEFWQRHEVMHEWQAWAERWAGQLASLPELADTLVAHATLGLEYRAAKTLSRWDTL